MNDIITVRMTSIGGETIQTVNARDLHAFLEIGRDFSTWVRSRIEQGGFEDECDFVVYSPDLGSGHTRIDYFLSLDMAKHLAMMERNEKGKQARQYFIECEKKLKELPTMTAMVSPDSGLVADLTIARFVADSLRISEASQLLMYSKIAKIHHRPTTFLPDYSEEKPTFSLTALLKQHNTGISAVKVNSILMDMGILEEQTRNGSKGEPKRFKALTEKGLKYGKNLISRENEKEVQPHYYIDTFPALIALIMDRILTKAA